MTTNPDARGPSTGDGYRMVPLMPDPRVQLERTAAAARAHAAQALSVAQMARAHALEAHRTANRARTAVRWNAVAIIVNTLVCAFLIAVTMGWL